MGKALKMIGGHVTEVRIRQGVGGMAFPNDHNWTCPVCKGDNRAFEDFCPQCAAPDDEGRCAAWTVR